MDLLFYWQVSKASETYLFELFIYIYILYGHMCARIVEWAHIEPNTFADPLTGLS